MANYKITERTRKDKNGNKLAPEKCIIVDFVNLTENERQAVEMYVKSGYTLYPKKEKTKAGKGLTTEKMRENLKKIGNEELLKDFEEKVETKLNFMKLTSWYKGEVKKIKSK